MVGLVADLIVVVVAGIQASPPLVTLPAVLAGTTHTPFTFTAGSSQTRLATVSVVVVEVG